MLTFLSPISTDSHSKAKSGLSPDCIKICVYAKDKFKQMCHQMEAGEITKINFYMISKHSKHIAELSAVLGTDHGMFMRIKQDREIQFEQFQSFSEHFEVLKENLSNSCDFEGMWHFV